MINKRKSIYIFCIILVIQLGILVYFGSQKMSYHIDEIYTNILSNSYHTDRISNSDKVFDKWIDGEDTFSEFVTVQDGEQFAYDKVYYNNSHDAHPPLYYFVYHTVSSIFPNLFSKWIGLGINIFFFVLTQLILYKLSCEIFSDSKWALIPPLIYGILPVCIDTILFIRMYAMLTFFTVLTFLIHYLLYKRRIKLPYLWTFLITFLGTFTQYYFAVVSFYLAVVFCIYYIGKKQIKDFILYSVSMISAIASVFLLYPAAWSQITGSSTNNIGNEVSNSIFDFSGFWSHLKSYLDQFYNLSKIPVLFAALIFLAILTFFIWSVVTKKRQGKPINLFTLGIALSVMFLLFLIGLYSKGTFAYFSAKINTIAKISIIILTVAIIVSAILYLCFRKKSEAKNIILLLEPAIKCKIHMVTVLLIVLLLTFFSVVHISSKFSYLRYVYNIVPLFILLIVLALNIVCTIAKVNSKTVLSAILVCTIIYSSGVVIGKHTTQLYVDAYENEKEFSELYQDLPVIVINNGSTYLLTSNFNRFVNCKDLYITNSYNQNFDKILEEKNLDKGVAFIVLTDKNWSNGYDGQSVMDSIISNSENLSSYKETGTAAFSTLYVANK